MGPPRVHVIACPHCGALAKIVRRSGNSMGARFWSDGRQIGPMLPNDPVVARCRSCRECYWCDRATRVGTIERRFDGDPPIDPAWSAAEWVEEPTEPEYYRALDGGLAKTPADERDARIYAWRRRNDAFRDAPPPAAAGATDDEVPWRKNLRSLIVLLDVPDVHDRIMRAEALRELGEFKAARLILGRVRDGEMASVVTQLRALCEQGDVWPRELRVDA